MKYGYTVADQADAQAFAEAYDFIVEKLCYTPSEPADIDVDGSMIQCFRKGEDTIRLEYDMQTDYVGIISDRKLPIRALAEFQEE